MGRGIAGCHPAVAVRFDAVHGSPRCRRCISINGIISQHITRSNSPSRSRDSISVRSLFSPIFLHALLDEGYFSRQASLPLDSRRCQLAFGVRWKRGKREHFWLYVATGTGDPVSIGHGNDPRNDAAEQHHRTRHGNPTDDALTVAAAADRITEYCGSAKLPIFRDREDVNQSAWSSRTRGWAIGRKRCTILESRGVTRARLMIASMYCSRTARFCRAGSRRYAATKYVNLDRRSSASSVISTSRQSAAPNRVASPRIPANDGFSNTREITGSVSTFRQFIEPAICKTIGDTASPASQSSLPLRVDACRHLLHNHRAPALSPIAHTATPHNSRSTTLMVAAVEHRVEVHHLTNVGLARLTVVSVGVKSQRRQTHHEIITSGSATPSDRGSSPPRRHRRATVDV